VAEQGSGAQEGAQVDRDVSKLRMIAAAAAVILVIMLAEGVIIYTLLRKGKAQTPGQRKYATMSEEGSGRENDLRAPSVEVNDIVSSVRVDTSGNKLRNMIVSLSIKLGRDQRAPEAVLDVRDLQKNYLPRIEDFVPEFRHMLLERISKKNYADLQKMSSWDEMLDELKSRCNERLEKQYGLKPRIAAIYVQTLSFD